MEPTQSVAPVGLASPPRDMRAIQKLPHYQPDFDYRPDLYEYNEFDTTNPAYVVLNVSFITPSPDHTAFLNT